MPTRNSATSGPIRREAKGEKRPYTPRGEGFRQDGDPSRVGDRPEGNSAATRNFRAARRIAARARILESSGSRCGSRRVQAVAEARRQCAGSCRTQFASAARWRAKLRQPRFDKPRFDKPREDRGGTSVRGFRDRARIVRKATAPNSTGRARRSDRPNFDRPREDRPERSAWQEHPRSEAATIVRAATTRMTARFSSSARPSAAAVLTASASPTNAAPRAAGPKKPGERIAKVVSRAGLARAATPRNGSCRAASRSMAA